MKTLFSLKMFNGCILIDWLVINALLVVLQPFNGVIGSDLWCLCVLGASHTGGLQPTADRLCWRQEGRDPGPGG